MRKRKHWQALIAAALVVASCRYRYEFLPTPTDQPGAGAAGEAPLSGGGPGPDMNGGAAAGGSPDEPAMGGNAASAAGEGGGGSSGVGGSSGSGGSSGGGSAVPPDMTLCNQGSHGGHDYLLCQEQRSWADAHGGCMAIGMRLVRVDDALENDWLFANANTPQGSDSAVWLGGTDEAAEGEWRWSDGELFWLGDDSGAAQGGLFAAWQFREPNDVDGENCASLETTSVKAEWYDMDCARTLAYICEQR